MIRGLAIILIAGAVACGQDNDDVELVDGDVVLGVDADRTPGSQYSWNQIEMELQSRGVVDNTKRRSAGRFAPTEGTYSDTTDRDVFYDSCSVSPANVIIVPDVVENLDTTTHTYEIATYLEGAEVGRSSCEYHGRFWRCDSGDQTLDWSNVLGPDTDATTTIRSASFGYWTTTTSFYAISLADFSCVGSDCDLPLVNTFMGNIDQTPCARGFGRMRFIME